MIRLHRPPIPQFLANRALVETNLLWTAWQLNQCQQPKIDHTVYAHPTVKQALRDAQHNKCAYCETIDARSFGVVEHYRPKSGWRQTPQDQLHYPEYFWLSYEWTNLLFACNMCNDAGHKQNHFPLNNPAQRATPANPTIAAEDPLLINPYETEPCNEMEWHRDVPRAKHASAKGRATITVFHLDSDQLLIDKRRDYFTLLDLTISLAENLTPEDPRRHAARNVLMTKLNDDAEYAAMTRENFAHRILAL